MVPSGVECTCGEEGSKRVSAPVERVWAPDPHPQTWTLTCTWLRGHSGGLGFLICEADTMIGYP